MIYLAAIQDCLLLQSTGRRNWGNQELESVEAGNWATSMLAAHEEQSGIE